MDADGAIPDSIATGVVTDDPRGYFNQKHYGITIEMPVGQVFHQKYEQVNEDCDKDPPEV